MTSLDHVPRRSVTRPRPASSDDDDSYRSTSSTSTMIREDERSVSEELAELRE